MDIAKLIAAAPLVRRAWRYTPAPLRIPLAVVGLGIVAWQFFRGHEEHPSVAEHEADVAADRTA